MMRPDSYAFPLEEASGEIQRGLTVLEYATIQVMAQLMGAAMSVSVSAYLDRVGTTSRFSTGDLAREAWRAAQALIDTQPK